MIPAEIVQDSAQRSGGLVTDFLRMLGVSCLKAKRDKLKTVNINASNAAFNELTQSYKVSIPESSYDKLILIHKTKNAANDEDFRNLLFWLAVLEYKEGDETWYDLHPALEFLLRGRGLLM